MKVRPLALSLACLLSGACASTPPPEIPRAEPTEAMQPCAAMLCTLGPGFGNLSLDDQAAMIANCRALDAEAFRVCEARHRALVEWVRAR